MKRCVFFDRDGIVNESPGPGYVERFDDFHLQPGFIAAARIALISGYAVAIATNQRGVARGIMTLESLDEIHSRMLALLMDNGINVLDVFCCPHENDTCSCRKPKPGLLLQAAQQHNLDLNSCWMVGDKETDVEAGQRAGCRTILVNAQCGDTHATRTVRHIDDLAELLRQVL